MDLDLGLGLGFARLGYFCGVGAMWVSCGALVFIVCWVWVVWGFGMALCLVYSRLVFGICYGWVS